MRTADWTGGRIRPKHGGRETAQLAQRLCAARRMGASRTRSAADKAIITRMALLEIARRRDEGRLVRLGPREYELHPRTAVQQPARNATIGS